MLKNDFAPHASYLPHPQIKNKQTSTKSALLSTTSLYGKILDNSGDVLQFHIGPTFMLLHVGGCS